MQGTTNINCSVFVFSISQIKIKACTKVTHGRGQEILKHIESYKGFHFNILWTDERNFYSCYKFNRRIQCTRVEYKESSQSTNKSISGDNCALFTYLKFLWRRLKKLLDDTPLGARMNMIYATKIRPTIQEAFELKAKSTDTGSKFLAGKFCWFRASELLAVRNTKGSNLFSLQQNSLEITLQCLLQQKNKYKMYNRILLNAPGYVFHIIMNILDDTFNLNSVI